MTQGNLTVLVTGATDGIGKETALELARRGARVIVHGRSADRAEAVTREVRAVREDLALPPLVVDFARLEDVRRAATELNQPIDVLVNNAGVFMKDPVVTADGFEMTFAVNHLAPFVLTHTLLRSASGRGLQRIVNVSSGMHGQGDLKIEHAHEVPARFDGHAAYAASKLANVLFTVELARRLGPTPTVNALHPGVVSTKMLTAAFSMKGSESLAEGAATSVLLALDPSVATTTGAYFRDEHQATPSALARDAALAKRFYEKSAELTRVEPFPAR